MKGDGRKRCGKPTTYFGDDREYLRYPAKPMKPTREPAAAIVHDNVGNKTQEDTTTTVSSIASAALKAREQYLGIEAIMPSAGPRIVRQST